MSRKHHDLKCETEFYQAVERGDKTFEVRYNDRDYTVGDMVTLAETMDGNYSGRKLQPKEIIYILEGGQFGIRYGFVVLQLK
jgi:uncharacterized protein DUF3850